VAPPFQISAVASLHLRRHWRFHQSCRCRGADYQQAAQLALQNEQFTKKSTAIQQAQPVLQLFPSASKV
jgi:hypothetical protein